MLKRKLFIALTLLLLALTVAHAQESTEEVPPPTNTFVPSETPLPPTATFTETATATYTETPSETPTLSETPTETATATPTASAEITMEVEITSEVTAEVTAELTATPTATLEAKVEPTRTAPPPPPVLPAGSQMLLSCDPNDLIIVPAGVEQALLDAIAVVNSCPSIHYTIYVQPSEDMIFEMNIIPNSPISISGNVTLYANNAIIRSNYSGPSTNTGYSLITVNSGAIVELQHVIIENGYNWAIGYGGGITNNGLLRIYDSILRSNRADNGGGGILNWGTLRIERTLFHANAADGGGAIRNINTFGGNITLTCNRFTTNGAFFGGAILGEGTFTSLSIVASYNTFDGNNASISDDIHNVAAGPPILAQNNYWGADGVADVNATVDASSPLNYDPTLENSSGYYTRPECRPITPHIVADEAIRFHLSTDQFGLPIPFTSLPYNINQQPGQADDPLGITTDRPVPSQGFGPSLFAYKEGDVLYSLTYQIHSGIDYGPANAWKYRVVISICDGVVIEGNWWIASGPYATRQTHGSAQPGRGVSIRCFVDSLENGRADTDGDGKPNLSNVIVTYNHLQWGPDDTLRGPDGKLQWRENAEDLYTWHAQPYFLPCSLVNSPGCDDGYELPRIGDVVLSGDVLGRTGGTDGDTATAEYDHLHLAIFPARGFARANSSDNVFYLNPLLLYRFDIVSQHVHQRYYRDESREADDPALGIEPDILTEWSAGGFNFYPNGRSTTNTFWTVQSYAPPQFPINEVEWPYDNYPLIPANDPLRIEELVEYLTQSFTQFPYIAPNCTLSIDNTRTPPKEVADAACYDSADLYDDTPYTPVAHPN